MSGRKEAAKKKERRQKGKQNPVYILVKEKPMKRNLVSWEVVMEKVSFSK